MLNTSIAIVDDRRDCVFVPFNKQFMLETRPSEPKTSSPASSEKLDATHYASQIFYTAQGALQDEAEFADDSRYVLFMRVATKSFCGLIRNGHTSSVNLAQITVTVH